MMQRRHRRALVLLSAIAMLTSPLSAQEAGVLVLDTTGFWRVHYRIGPPVARKDPASGAGGKVETLEFPQKWLMRGTPLPPAGWEKPDFDDSGWARFPGMLNVSPSYHVLAFKSPFVSLECLRGKFNVTDPAKAGQLTLTASYHGGIVVYLNGTEVARKNLPPGGGVEGLADDYVYEKYDPKTPETKRRELGDVKIPPHLVQKGVNVLTLEVHRSAYDTRDVILEGRRSTKTIAWGSGGLASVRLRSSGGDGVRCDYARPTVFHVWNSEPMQVDTDLDYGDLNETLKPIRIVGTRNGAFSGKVVIGSPNPIRGLRAVMSDLVSRPLVPKGPRGPEGRTGGTIAAASVRVRYAKADTSQAGIQHRYLEYPACFGGLEEFPPEEVTVRTSRSRPWSFKPFESPGVSVVFGAVQPVWITVNVPADATPGDYEGTLTISAADEQTVRVPVSVRVCGFKLPAPGDYHTWVDITDSPESVAMQYEVPFWSDDHLKRMGKSLTLLSRVGQKVVHIRLICRTNAGNAQSMVRWVKQAPSGNRDSLGTGDGGYTYDFTPMEKYLDLVEACGIRPSVVCFQVWDTYLEGGRGGPEQYAGEAVQEARAARADDGPVVSMIDPATPQAGQAGKIEEVALPKYSTPEKSLPMWKPLMEEIARRMKKRGLERAMMIGLSTDNHPAKEVVDFFRKVAPGVPWVSHGHSMPHELDGVPVKYLTGVWAGGKFPSDPSVGRTYGWMRTFSGLRSNEFSAADGAVLAHHPRNPWENFPVTSYRALGEMNIAGQQRGFGRIGADFWPVLKDKRGRLIGSLSARYPETRWRNLDIRSCILSPGRDGAISTQRFEMMREGIQECEARIFIERAILEKKIDGDLADRCQEVLDERIPPLRIGTSLLAQQADADNTWWNWPGSLGYNWYVGSGWQERSEKLYSAAAEVARALEK
ncbi:MAG TPA: glycoside hydrolase domain-containing protein [Planctomycetota bacterium]|nr:glycoside hydrolase domain-containing protein [Planctomycetota bacterium]